MRLNGTTIYPKLGEAFGCARSKNPLFPQFADNDYYCTRLRIRQRRGLARF